METATTFSRVSDKGQSMSATEKKVLLALVNANNPDYFGKWMKANRINIKVEKISETEFNVETRAMKMGFGGKDWSVLTFNNVTIS